MIDPARVIEVLLGYAALRRPRQPAARRRGKAEGAAMREEPRVVTPQQAAAEDAFRRLDPGTLSWVVTHLVSSAQRIHEDTAKKAAGGVLSNGERNRARGAMLALRGTAIELAKVADQVQTLRGIVQ